MRSILIVLILASASVSFGQTRGTELSTLITKLITDSTGFENIGDWAIGNATKYPVTWKTDLVMSDDPSINFYRSGLSSVMYKGKTLLNAMNRPLPWEVMLKGPRMGYSSYTIISGASAELNDFNIESLFPDGNVKSKLIKTCNTASGGFDFYEVKITGKDLHYLKISRAEKNGATALRIDGYDSYAMKDAKLDCPN
jgi:hypothetical protein